MPKGSKGQVVQVIGTVVDVEFPAGQLPEIYNAIEIAIGGDGKLIAEVQQHLGNNWVRALAMDTTDGLARGTAATPLEVIMSANMMVICWPIPT